MPGFVLSRKRTLNFGRLFTAVHTGFKVSLLNGDTKEKIMIIIFD